MSSTLYMRVCSVLIVVLLIGMPFLSEAQQAVHLDPVRVEDMVIERSFGVKQLEMTRDAAAEAIPEAKGTFFDTYFSGSAGYNLDKARQQNLIFGTRTDSVTWNLGFSKELSPTGTTLGLTFDNDWAKTIGSPVIGGVPIIPPVGRYEPVLGFSLSQPLMKNAFGVNDRATVQVARHSYASTDYAVRREVDKVIYKSLLDYWTLLFTRKHMTALKRAIGFAQEFLNTTLEEEKLGIAVETDVLAAQANLQARKNEYNAYKELERTALEDLRTDLALEPDQELILADRLPPRKRVTSGIDDMIAKAMTRRGDYRSALEDLRRERVNVKMARNKRWPQLDLVSTLDMNEISRDYGVALGGMNNPNVTVGLALSVPLENRAARAGARRAQADKARAVYAVKGLENRIANQIAHLAQSMGDRLLIVEGTRKSLNLNLKKQKLELDKYKVGMSSSDLVRRSQDDSINSMRALFEAWLLYQRTVLDLKLAQGAMIAESAEVVEQ